MNIGRPLSAEAQQLAREQIARHGLDRAAKMLRVSSYLLAKGAAGAAVAELSADALEIRLQREAQAA
ncbi:MAG: hypothetical protein QM756_26615 [Polyangiaceae bacterium]